MEINPSEVTKILKEQIKQFGDKAEVSEVGQVLSLSLIHISEPTRHAQISYAVFCLKK